MKTICPKEWVGQDQVNKVVYKLTPYKLLIQAFRHTRYGLLELYIAIHCYMHVRVSTFLHCSTLTWNTQLSLRITSTLPHITIRAGSGIPSLSGWWRLTAEWLNRATGQLGPPPIIVVHIWRCKKYSMDRVDFSMPSSDRPGVLITFTTDINVIYTMTTSLTATKCTFWHLLVCHGPWRMLRTWEITLF